MACMASEKIRDKNNTDKELAIPMSKYVNPDPIKLIIMATLTPFPSHIIPIIPPPTSNAIEKTVSKYAKVIASAPNEEVRNGIMGCVIQ